MGLFSRFKRMEAKDHPSGGAFLVGAGTSWASWVNRDAYIKEGYQGNVYVYRAIDEITRAGTSIDIELYNGDELVEEHEVLDLLQRPNPAQSGDAFTTENLVNRLLFGEIFSVAAGSGPGMEVWPLNPDDMEVKPSSSGVPASYVHEKAGFKKTYPVNPRTGESDVFCLKTYNPSNYWRGQSPLVAGAVAVDTHNAGVRWNYSLLKNGARPSGLIQFKNAYPGSETLQRMREYFKRGMQGEYNAGEIPMLAEDAEWVEISKSPKDMDFTTTMKEMAKYIASIYGVPLPLIDNDASTFNNVEQAKERLYTDTVIPLMEEYLQALGNWLFPRFGIEGYCFKLDLDTVPALEGIRQRKFDRAVEAFNSGLLTDEESRQMMGFPAQPEGGQLKPAPAPVSLPDGEEKGSLSGVEIQALLYGLQSEPE